MRTRVLLIASAMLFSILVIGCQDSAGTIQNHEEKESKNEEYLGASEFRRKIIFGAILEAEDRADKEAEERYPTYSGPNASGENVQPNAELSKELAEKYTAEVRAEYEISKDEQIDIGNEGVTKGWLEP